MSTPKPPTPDDEWISQAEAARLRQVSRQAISRLIKRGRLATRTVAGYVLVRRRDVLQFEARAAGRPRKPEKVMSKSTNLEELKHLVDDLDDDQRRQLYNHLRARLPPHPVEQQLMITAEGMLEAFARAGDFTVRMIRGVFAEGAFAAEVLPTLAPQWQSLPISGDPPYDFLLTDEPKGSEPQGAYSQVRVQVKLQRSGDKQPLPASEVWKSRVNWPSTHWVVELQKSRAGRKKGGESTRPYRFGEFDIVAVSLGPSRGRWSAFIYTVERWLLPDPSAPTNILKYQPVAPEDCDCWTTDFNTAVMWLRSGEKRRITGEPPRRKRPSRKNRASRKK
jgi:hypothetical protein